MRAFTVACLSAGLSLLPAAGAPAPDLSEIKARGSLRIAVLEGVPEFFAWGPGQAPGFDREILEGFAGLHRVGISVVPRRSWDAVLSAVAEGKADLAAGGVPVTEAARARVEFSTEVLPSRLVIVTRRPGAVVTTAAELQQQRVGVARGEGAAELGEAGVSAADDTLPDAAALLEALKAGRVGCVVLRVEQAVLAARSDKQLQVGMAIGQKRSLAYAMRKEDEALRRSLNEYLGNFRRSASWNRLLVTYFKDGAPKILKAAKE